MSQSFVPKDGGETQDRELSWLAFNQRVLEEAADGEVPLLERLRFLSIFTSNLDEFYRVRVGSLLDWRLTAAQTPDAREGEALGEELREIYRRTGALVAQRDQVYDQVSRALADRGVVDLPYGALKGQERERVRTYYKQVIRPLLAPQIIDPSHPFPHLKNKGLYAAALLWDRERDRRLLGIVGVPDAVEPVIFLGNGAFVRTETVLLHYLKKLFSIYRMEERVVIAVTRNADISYEERYDDEAVELRSHMTKLIRQRDRLAPVRLELQGRAPALEEALLGRLGLPREQSFSCRCPLVLSYAYAIESPDPALLYPPHVPQWPEALRPREPVWDQVARRDVLLFYPYHTMEPFLNLLREAAQDPRVLSIQITLYRLARKSAVAKHLCAAAEQGKAVTVLVELRARFDEQNNIQWARELEEAGCRILYGPAGYKCHAKVCLITRREKNGLSYLTQVGTGNYNEKTAALYTDFALLTARRAIAADAVAFFQNMLIGDLAGRYEKLLVAPAGLHHALLRQIDGQIARGREGRILLKTNGLTDRELMERLVLASQAGVTVELIVRGVCCLLPGIPGKTEGIQVTSLVGRFLEHSRVYVFGRGERCQVYLSSADLMTRNQWRRVEVACPVEDPELAGFLLDYLERILGDNQKAKLLQPDGSYRLRPRGKEPPRSVQQYYLDHPIRFSRPDVQKKGWARLRRWLEGRGNVLHP